MSGLSGKQHLCVHSRPSLWNTCKTGRPTTVYEIMITLVNNNYYATHGCMEMHIIIIIVPACDPEVTLLCPVSSLGP